jgi:hypothetical protein
MSILALPRLYFRGEIWWSTSTANSAVTDLFDRTTGTVRVPSGTTPQSFRDFLAGVHAGVIKGGHNIYGDNSCGFTPNTLVHGGVLPDLSAVRPDDAICSQAVQIVGSGNTDNVLENPCRITDVDPYAGWSSQLFLDRLLVGNDTTGFRAGAAVPTMFRGFDYHRNFNAGGELVMSGPAAVVWQTTFPKNSLTCEPGASRVLHAFADALEQTNVDGIMLRFCTYRTEYFRNGLHGDLFKTPTPRNEEELSRLYRAGQVFENPAWSLVIGTIGLWLNGEPRTSPSGRYVGPGVPVRPFGLKPDKTKPTPVPL